MAKFERWNRPHGYVDTVALDPAVIEGASDWWEDKSLTAAIASIGQLDEIAVWYEKLDPETGRGEVYHLVAGRGRCASCRALGIKVRADVYDCELSALAAIGLAENVKRANPLGAAEMLETLQKAGKSAEELLAVSGMNATQRQAALDLLKLPGDLREEIKRGELKLSAARWLLKLPDTKTRRKAWKLAQAANKVKDKPRPHPTVEDVKAAVRGVRSEMQPQMSLDQSSCQVIQGETIKVESRVDPVRLAGVLRDMRLQFKDGTALAAVISELELM